MFVTLLYMVINKTTKEVRMVRAGHNAPLLYNARHRKVLHLQPRGIAIGLDQSGSLFQSELEIQRFFLHPGDILVAYTDGIIEGKNRNGDDYGDERFTRVIYEHHKESAQEIVNAVVHDVRSHEKGAEQSDDITLLVMKAE